MGALALLYLFVLVAFALAVGVAIYTNDGPGWFCLFVTICIAVVFAF